MNTEFLKPKYWAIWFVYALLRAVVWLPHDYRMWIGRKLGALFYLVSPKRRAVASINLSICFPEFDENQRNNILREHFGSLGMAVIESAMSWILPAAAIKPLVELEGVEHLHQAMQQNKGVILLSGHFNSLEISLPCFVSSTPYPANIVFQANSNALLEAIISKGRNKNSLSSISHLNIRQMIRALKRSEIVWYAPDQGYTGKFSEIVPFFDTPSASNTAISRLAKMTGALVVPFFIRQNPKKNGYTLSFQAALEGFPTDDAITDTMRYHRILEEAIRKVPAQYLWIHRRFKKRPKQYPDVYQDIVLRK